MDELHENTALALGRMRVKHRSDPAIQPMLAPLDSKIVSRQDALADAGLEKAKDFAEAGGGLLVLGDRFAFSRGSDARLQDQA